VHPNEALIERFYRAFQARDAATMGTCYHPDIVFSDPAFPELRGLDAFLQKQTGTAAAPQRAISR
jgi:ketosteroid isomerase-like protein